MTPQQKEMATTTTNQTSAASAASSMPVIMARKVPPSALEECGARLRAGDLVAFPTETVYGLGCHALDPIAIGKVFTAKERPLTDPLIVHVAHVQEALDLWDSQCSMATLVLTTLANQFWPGPLTLVAKAASHVPPTVMAHTGYVACRCPRHALALQLLHAAQVPIAAPSANKFGHVSPTCADHVMDDLGLENVWILEQDEQDDSQQDSQLACAVGVESTVAKLEQVSSAPGEPVQYLLTVLRQGAVSVQDLQDCISTYNNDHSNGAKMNVVVTSRSNRAVKDDQATVAPGQTIKHYSPRIPSYLLASNLYDNHHSSSSTTVLQQFLQQSILLDFGGKLVAYQNVARQYRDLSPTGDSSQAAQCVFEALRWAERIDPDAKTIVFPQLGGGVIDNNNNNDSAAAPDALTLALQDRLTRAASGVVLDSVDAIAKILQ